MPLAAIKIQVSRKMVCYYYCYYYDLPPNNFMLYEVGYTKELDISRLYQGVGYKEFFFASPSPLSVVIWRVLVVD